MSFYNEEELKDIGLKSFGKNVLISRKTSIYGAENISIGDNVRIDDFCILSGVIKIKNYVHISAGVYLYAGDAGIEINEFSGISSKTVIYAISDDFSGSSLIGPMIDKKYRNVFSKKVYIGKHVQIGTSCVILPGATLNEGISVGAMSLVNSNLEDWSLYIGIPAKKIKERKKELLRYEQKMKENVL
ncbi:acyltransferase [uncultured Ilyobacter sp.]|uniref:acyltransferase n=1 Tax=uncultured Ilyobacter sp. TaxID=544433 RepID=UPI0029C98969|nr:acyltransferase [uncultured Ilyobacter sp.]